jgi:hypothetical protein
MSVRLSIPLAVLLAVPLAEFIADATTDLIVQARTRNCRPVIPQLVRSMYLRIKWN